MRLTIITAGLAWALSAAAAAAETPSPISPELEAAVTEAMQAVESGVVEQEPTRTVATDAVSEPPPRKLPALPPLPPVEAAGTAAPPAPDSALAPRTQVSPPAAQAPQLDSHLDWLNGKAEAAMAAKRLTTPAGDSAVDYYRQMLQVDADNPAARAGLRKIADTYVAWGRSAAGRGQLGRVKSFRTRADSVVPGSGAALDADVRRLEATAARGRGSVSRGNQDSVGIKDVFDDIINLRTPEKTDGGASILDY
jgi:hypothetical protein